MAKELIVRLTDDLDGGEADQTIEFTLNGRAYEIDLSNENAEKLRIALKPYIDKGRFGQRQGLGSQASKRGSSGEVTLFSKLDAGEKKRFRGWADLPTARRIADRRVEEWIEAGRP